MQGQDVTASRVLFFNINGSGLGHMNRCLAYARRLPQAIKPVFFSLASAVEIIQEMGFEADYLVSPFWSRSSKHAWNRELSVRLGMMLEHTQPDIAVFDGTWPFHGFMDACRSHGVPRLVWSNRGLYKSDVPPVPVSERAFDLILEPGEIGSCHSVIRQAGPGRKVTIPPVALLDQEEILSREAARQALELDPAGRYVLCSLGPGNLKDVSGIGEGLMEEFEARGLQVLWARAPISQRDLPLPDSVRPLSIYPLARYLRAFDAFVGAAGYNTCCEVLQSQRPSLLVPNTQVGDDQARRAHMVADHAPVVVSACESPEQRREAVTALLDLASEPSADRQALALDGAQHGADEMVALLNRGGAA